MKIERLTEQDILDVAAEFGCDADELRKAAHRGDVAWLDRLGDDTTSETT